MMRLLARFRRLFTHQDAANKKPPILSQKDKVGGCFIFGFDENAKNINDSHIVYLDTTPYAKGQGDFAATCDELFGGNKE